MVPRFHDVLLLLKIVGSLFVASNWLHRDRSKHSTTLTASKVAFQSAVQR